jgi:hypothetical protein
MTKANQIEIAAAIFQSVKDNANDFNDKMRANPLALKATIAVMAKAEKAKADTEKEKGKAFYAAMTKGGLGVFFDNDAKQERSLAMELGGMRKCAKNDLHVLSDTDFKAMIKNHTKEITSVRQFAADHFKTASTPKTESGNDGNDESESGNDDALLDTPTEKSIADQYADFIKSAFAGNPKAFWKWIEQGNNEAIEAGLTNAKRKAQPELPKLKSLAA